MLTNRLLHMSFNNMIKKEHPPTAEERTFFEGGPGGGSGSGRGDGSGSGSGTDKGKRKEDPNSQKSKYVEDFSTKREKQGKAVAGKDKKRGGDKGKGKQVMTYEDFYYYQGKQDDFQAFKAQEELEEVLPGENEY